MKQLRLPPAAACPDPVADLIEEHHRLRSQLRDVVAYINDDHGHTLKAQAEDRAATAAAIRAGKKDPGPKHLDEHRTKLADAKRRRGALREALQGVETDLRAAIDTHRTGWCDTLATDLAGTLDALTTKLDEATDLATQVQHLTALHRWATNPDTGYRPSRQLETSLTTFRSELETQLPNINVPA
jgi:hypothetical protein